MFSRGTARKQYFEADGLYGRFCYFFYQISCSVSYYCCTPCIFCETSTMLIKAPFRFCSNADLLDFSSKIVVYDVRRKDAPIRRLFRNLHDGVSKNKEIYRFSHQPGNCKTKRAGILCGLPAFLTLQAAVPVEKAENFHFSEST